MKRRSSALKENRQRQVCVCVCVYGTLFISMVREEEHIRLETLKKTLSSFLAVPLFSITAVTFQHRFCCEDITHNIKCIIYTCASRTACQKGLWVM